MTDVIVSTKFDHGWIGDLFGWLQRTGTTVELFDARSSGLDGIFNVNQDVDVSFSDAGALQPYNDIYDPYNGFGVGGDRRPIDQLSAFDGQQANGLWTLSILDNIPLTFYNSFGTSWITNTGGTFGEWELKLQLSRCPNPVPAKSDGNNNFMDFEEIFDGHNDNNKYAFIEFIGLNVVISILTTVFVICMVYCICCKSRNKSSKGYGRIGTEVNVDGDEDELPIKENI